MTALERKSSIKVEKTCLYLWCIFTIIQNIWLSTPVKKCFRQNNKQIVAREKLKKSMAKKSLKRKEEFSNIPKRCLVWNTNVVAKSAKTGI